MARAAAAASKYEEMVVSRTKKKTGQGNQGKTVTMMTFDDTLSMFNAMKK